MQVNVIYQIPPNWNIANTNALTPTVRAPRKLFFTSRRLPRMSSSKFSSKTCKLRS